MLLVMQNSTQMVLTDQMLEPVYKSPKMSCWDYAKDVNTGTYDKNINILLNMLVVQKTGAPLLLSASKLHI